MSSSGTSAKGPKDSVWVDEAPRRLRARLLEPVGLEGPELSVRVTDGLDRTAAAVRDWLSEVLGPGAEPA